MQSDITVFMSYVRNDIEKVLIIKDYLIDCGLTVWIDTECILPGEKWDEKIKKALSLSDFIVLCLSANSINKRGYLQREIRIALNFSEEMLDSDIYIIPVLLEQCELPSKLSHLQYVEFFSQNGPERLVSGIIEGAKRRGVIIENKTNSKKKESVDLSTFGELKLFSKLFRRK